MKGPGPTLDNILEQSDVWLEETHDYIQWLFPTRQPSQYVKNAPRVTTEDLHAVATGKDIVQTNMLRAFERMLEFYGAEMVIASGKVVNETRRCFDPKAKWMRHFDHNAKRLTRIITSLRPFSLEEHADALQAFLLRLPQLSTHPSQCFWQQA